MIQSFLPLFKSNRAFSGNSDSRSPELFNVFILISICSVLAVIVLLIFRKAFESSFNNSAEIRYFILLLAYIFFSCPAYLTEYIYLLKNRPASILIYGTVTFFIQFVIVSGAAVLGYDIYYCIAGIVMVTIVRYLWLLILLQRYARPKLSLPFISEHLRFGYPLIVSALLGSSAQYIDGFLVMHRYDASTFAVFQYGAREFPLVLLMANAFSTAMIPEFNNENDAKVRSIVNFQ